MVDIVFTVFVLYSYLINWPWIFCMWRHTNPQVLETTLGI